MMNDGYVMRTMSREELDVVIEWAAAEGWNPGFHDAGVFYEADPSGFFVGLLDGQPISSISAVKYGPDYAFVGFYIVKPEHRGNGYGLRLWQHAMATLQGGIAGLDGVLAQTGNYEASGFENAYHNMRYQGVARASSQANPDITPFTTADLEAVETYDASCFPAPRRAFLAAWLQLPESHVLLHRQGDSLSGYGVIRAARNGYRIGPLFANDPLTAAALFDALTARVPAGSEVYMDIPQLNPAALELVTQRDMTPMFETARMYRGGTPKVALERVFGVTTLELG